MRHVLLGWGGDGPGVGIGHPELSRHSQYTPLQKPKEAEQGAGCVLLRPWGPHGGYPSRVAEANKKNLISSLSRVALGAILALL